jgi:hypothetical protein
MWLDLGAFYFEADNERSTKQFESSHHLNWLWSHCWLKMYMPIHCVCLYIVYAYTLCIDENFTGLSILSAKCPFCHILSHIFKVALRSVRNFSTGTVFRHFEQKTWEVKYVYSRKSRSYPPTERTFKPHPANASWVVSTFGDCTGVLFESIILISKGLPFFWVSLRPWKSQSGAYFSLSKSPAFGGSLGPWNRVGQLLDTISPHRDSTQLHVIIV